MAYLPIFQVISATMWRVEVLISFIGNLIFTSFNLLNIHHSFSFLLNIPILLQRLICIMIQISFE